MQGIQDLILLLQQYNAPLQLHTASLPDELLLEQVRLHNVRLYRSGNSRQAYRDCTRQWLAVQCLTDRQVNTLAIPLARQMARIAEKYELTQLSIELYAFLRIQYCLGNQRNLKQCQHAGLRQQYFLEVYDAEYRAKRRYSNLSIELTQQPEARAAVAAQARLAYRQLKPDIRRYQTCALIQFGYLLRVLQHLATGKPDKVSGLCAKAIRKLQAKHFDTHLHAQSFYYMQLAAQIQLGQYDAGLQSLDQLLGCVQAGDFNWFKFRELGLMLMLHTARYEEAVFLFNETVSNPCSEALSESNMLYWEMCCNYLMLLHRAGTVETEPQRGRLPVNDEPWQNRIEPEENMAPYTALLILDWLRLFQEQRHAELRRLSINLNRHAIRYQKLGVQTRSYCFLKFLCLLSSTDFTGEAMDTLAISAMEQLGKVPVQIAQQTLEIELIPYDALWRLIRKMPEQKDRKSAPSGVTHSAGSGSCGA